MTFTDLSPSFRAVVRDALDRGMTVEPYGTGGAVLVGARRDGRNGSYIRGVILWPSGWAQDVRVDFAAAKLFRAKDARRALGLPAETAKHPQHRNPAPRRWQKVAADEWELLDGDAVVVELVRDYPGRWGAVGKGWVKDRTKPVFWTLIREGMPSVRPCKDGTSLAEAKRAAERIVGASAPPQVIG